MPIYLVQHGLSLPKDQDPERGLSEEGVAETNRIAEVAKGYGVKVDIIFHSGKKRAHQTACIFADALQPVQGVKSMGGIDPLDDADPIAATLDGGSNAMLVGHLPFMSRLTAFLTTGQTEKPVFKFQNSGIVCLDQETETEAWAIHWTLMPHIG